jgi:diaminohydroxyphosphoribosylaminopyrimidine deaminase/5-amino-6-(5-phosphoribosylamino)uracil reductase
VLVGGKVLLVYAGEVPERRAALEAAGAEVLCLPDSGGRVDLTALLGELARRGVNELHVEGGAGLNGALLAAGLVDEWLAYFAPVALGDRARGLFEMAALTAMADRKGFTLLDAGLVGGDLRLRLRPWAAADEFPVLLAPRNP